jgi:serine/threonine protein kinase
MHRLSSLLAAASRKREAQSISVVLAVSASALALTLGALKHREEDEQERVTTRPKSEYSITEGNQHQTRTRTNNAMPSISEPNPFHSRFVWNHPSSSSVTVPYLNGHIPTTTTQCEAAVLPSRLFSSFERLEASYTVDDKGDDKSKSASASNKGAGTLLGQGAFSSVYLGHEKKTDLPVAVKKISKQYTDTDSFERELRALLHIRKSGGHPHICSLHKCYDDEQHYYLVLDYISGGEMFQHLIRNGAYSEAEAARLVREVASTLAFLHGIGVVHADLKPENIMLSRQSDDDGASNAVVKLVDFGSAEIVTGGEVVGCSTVSASDFTLTPAYAPPEVLNKTKDDTSRVESSMDMWALGVILYIMLVGMHPFDPNGGASDDEIEEYVKDVKRMPSIRNSRYTRHLSPSAVELIEGLMNRDPKQRMTAEQMLEHPWVRGETATTDIIKGSAERLSKFRAFKTKLQARFFQDVVAWSDNEDELRKRTNLMEKSFLALQHAPALEDMDKKGEMNMNEFHNLLSENMKHRYFKKGHCVYKEGDVGNHMYFINSGTIEVTTGQGSRAVRGQGDFFGEGALLHPRKIRSATIKCETPVHVMEISREYFEKYMATSESGLMLDIKEKDKIRKRNHAKSILLLQKNLKKRTYRKGKSLFRAGQSGDSLYIIESGKVGIGVNNQNVFSALPGNICGEHSVITGRKRNSSAVCLSDTCVCMELSGRDFRKLMETSPDTMGSIEELCWRRDFKKAVALKLKKDFPYDNPREAFDAVNESGAEELDAQAIGKLLREMDPEYTDDEIQSVIKVMDLTASGSVSFDEFKKVFVANVRTSAAM